MPSVLAMLPNDDSTTPSRVRKEKSKRKGNNALQIPPIPPNIIQQMNNSYPPNTNGHNYRHSHHHQRMGYNGNNNGHSGNGHLIQRESQQRETQQNGCNGHRNDYNHRNKKHANNQQYASKVSHNQSQSNTLQSNTNTETTKKRRNGDGQKLTSDPRFLENRSPFYETVSRHCVMPICQKQLINFQFNLPNPFVIDIQNRVKSQKKSNKKKMKQVNKTTTTTNINNRVLQIRLFDLKEKKHVDWSPNLFKLLINEQQVEIPPILTEKNKKKKLGQKAKGFRFVQPLDISKYAKERMDFEIACHKEVFHGAASIEIVNLLTVDQIAQRVEARSALASKLKMICDSKEQLTQKCAVCGKQDNLSRCSRCKSTWYCGGQHQQQDWENHHLGCQPFEKLNSLRLSMSDPKLKNNKNNKSDDIICNEMVVSIKDPLTLCRIKTPVRGINCYHPQCVDLRTYLSYCHNTKTWQCPICMQPLLYKHLVVDKSMDKIIKELNHDIDQVRLNADDYSYKIITLKEIQEKENPSSSNNRKRKYRDVTTLSDDENDSNKQNKRKSKSSVTPKSNKKKKKKRRKINHHGHNDDNNNDNNNKSATRTRKAKKPSQPEVIVID